MMMQGLRKAGQSLIGRIVVAIMFGFLIISFAIWGIGDIFRGYGRNAVAVVGKTEIGLEQVRTAYQNEIQQLQRQQRRQISPDLARALGLDQRVLSRLVTDAVLDQTAAKMGLAVSDVPAPAGPEMTNSLPRFAMRGTSLLYGLVVVL